MARLKNIIFHPIGLALYPVLALLTQNLEATKPEAAVRSLITITLGTVMLWGSLKLILKSWQWAAVLTSLFLILFFSYGHVYQTLFEHPVLGLNLGRHRILLGIWLALFMGVIWLGFRKLREPERVNQMLNLVVLVLLAFPLVQYGNHFLKTRQAEESAHTAEIRLYELNIPAGTLPDIYYIILDAYPRQDALQERVGYDNQSFLDELRLLGFYVADCAQSNYSQTELSLASSLNFDYLNMLGDNFIPGNTDRYDLGPLIRNSQVRLMLDDMGYIMVAFETGHAWTALEDADVYFSQAVKTINPGEGLIAVNPFEAMLIRSTFALALTDSITLMGPMMPDMDYPNKTHRERILYTLETLQGVPQSVRSPKFVFAHIITPHFPIVFGIDGELVEVSELAEDEIYNAFYRDQLTYINQRVLNLVQQIQAESAVPPIIIIQGDHGYDRQQIDDRTSILYALYLPGGGYEQLYPEITPVNTFRVIFDQVFGGNIPLLEDRSYYSYFDSPYEYILVPNQCTAGR